MVLDEFNKYAEHIGEALSGVLSVSFIGIEKGNLLFNKSFSKLNYEATAKFEAEIAKNALQEIKFIDNASEDSLKEIVVSNTEQEHVIYVSTDFSYLIHIIADASKLNLGMLKIVHTQAYNELQQNASFEDIQKELFPVETQRKVSHFRKLFFN